MGNIRLEMETSQQEMGPDRLGKETTNKKWDLTEREWESIKGKWKIAEGKYDQLRGIMNQMTWSINNT